MAVMWCYINIHVSLNSQNAQYMYVTLSNGIPGTCSIKKTYRTQLVYLHVLITTNQFKFKLANGR